MSGGSPRAIDTLEELAARAQQGDEDSFHELAGRVREPLRRFVASRMTGEDEADDVVQETLMRAHQNLDRYDPSRSFQTWLFTIGKRLAINHGRASRRRRALADEAATMPMRREAEPAGELGELWTVARRCLSAEQYRGLWLRYAHDRSVKEIASELDRSVVATKVMLFRARKRLLSKVVS